MPGYIAGRDDGSIFNLEIFLFIFHCYLLFFSATSTLMTPFTLLDDYPADLGLYNTMALVSHAKRHVFVNRIDEILPLVSQLRNTDAPFVVLSGGSNSILPPLLDATVIFPSIKGQAIIEENDSHITLEVMAGENWHTFVVSSTQQGWFGLENLALIPGWVGSCPVQNIGAYGVQVEDVIANVTALHIPTLTWHTLSKQECNFGYRDSLFKQQAGEWLIAKVTFTLSKTPAPKMQYGEVASIAHNFAQKSGNPTPSPIDVMNAIIQIRSSKLPDPSVLPNCGSFFKNPIVSKSQVDDLLLKFPNLVNYPTNDDQKIKVAAGWLIDDAGLKGKGVAPIFTHDKQALVLTNHAPLQANQTNIKSAVTYIQQTVMSKFGIMLEPEPVWIEKNGSSGIFRA